MLGRASEADSKDPMSIPLQLQPTAELARGKRSPVTCRLKCR